LGTRHREMIVPPGTQLTAVGEVTFERAVTVTGAGARAGAAEAGVGTGAAEGSGAATAVRAGAGAGAGTGVEGGTGSDGGLAGGGGGGGSDGGGSGGGGFILSGSGGGLRLRQPRPGAVGRRVFTVTQQPFDDYVKTLGTFGKVFTVGSTIFVVAGAGLCAVKLVKARLVRRRERRYRRRLAEVDRARRAGAYSRSH